MTRACDDEYPSRTAGGVTTSCMFDVNRALSVVLEDGRRKYVWGLGLVHAVDGTGKRARMYDPGIG